MNEVVIKELIKYKLNAAAAIVNSMPPEAAEEIRNLGRIIIEGINESCSDMKVQKPSGKNKLNNIEIE